MRLRYVSSETLKDTQSGETSHSGLSAEDLQKTVDLRVFMDPAPHTISELAPMASVYHVCRG